MVKYILAIVFLAFSASTVNGQQILGTLTRTACEGTNLTLDCSPGFFIKVDLANYGRLTDGCYGVCPKNGTDSNALCFSGNATTYLRSQCDERSNCTIPASNDVFGDTCPGIYKYLQSTYSCLRFERACENSTMKISCPIGKSIIVSSANYGRTLPGSEVCPSSDPSTTSNTRCRASNSTAIVQKQCNYRNSCSVQASNTLFGNPCRGTDKYLQATYYCL